MDRTRASDTERERVVGILREAHTHGRISIEELDERSAAAYAALTRSELARLIDDLPKPPAPEPRPAPPPPPAGRVRVHTEPFSAPGFRAPAPPPWISHWPDLRPWLPGWQRFAARWRTDADPREAARIILDHVIPLLMRDGFEVAHRTQAEIVLTHARGVIVQIDLKLRDDHTETHIWGVAPRSVRQGLQNLSR